MKEFISEYGFVITEGIGGVIGLSLLYNIFFGKAFAEFVGSFLSSLMGG